MIKRTATVLISLKDIGEVTLTTDECAEQVKEWIETCLEEEGNGEEFDIVVTVEDETV
jgi:hypothetical protein